MPEVGRGVPFEIATIAQRHEAAAASVWELFEIVEFPQIGADRVCNVLARGPMQCLCRLGRWTGGGALCLPHIAPAEGREERV